MDEVTDPSLSVLAEDDNGYLNYEYSEFLNSEGDFVEFDSYLIASDSSSFDDTTFLSSNVNGTYTKVSHNLSQSFYNCQKSNYTICISF